MTDLHVCSIPITHLAWCGDCLRAFDVTNRACPKCGTTCGWAVIPFGGREDESAADTRPAARKEDIRELQPL